MEGLLAPLFDLAIAIAAAFIQLIGWLLVALISNTWLAAHRSGLRRAGHIVAALMAAYLLFGIARPMTPVLYTPALQPLYAFPLVIASVILLFVGMAMGDVARRVDGGADTYRPAIAKPEPADGPVQTQSKDNRGWLALIVLVVLGIGVLTLVRTEQHEETLADRLCAQAQARISDTVEDRVRQGAGVLDRLFGTQTADRIPCGDR